MSEEALQIAVKRREVKGKGERERYSHLNAELQRIARRDKKAFLSDQCKFHAKMVSIKDRNDIGLTEAEDIKRWQEHTEELNKKDLHNPDNHDIDGYDGDYSR